MEALFTDKASIEQIPGDDGQRLNGIGIFRLIVVIFHDHKSMHGFTLFGIHQTEQGAAQTTVRTIEGPTQHTGRGILKDVVQGQIVKKQQIAHLQAVGFLLC